MLCNGCGKSVGSVSRLCEDCAAAAARQSQVPQGGPERQGSSFSKVPVAPVSAQEVLSKPSIRLASILFVSLCLFAYNLLAVGDRLGPVSLALLFLGNTFALIGALSFLFLWFGMLIDNPVTGLLFFVSPGALRRYLVENWRIVRATAFMGILSAGLALVTTFSAFTQVPTKELDLFLQRSYVAYWLGYAGTSDQEEIGYDQVRFQSNERRDEDY